MLTAFSANWTAEEILKYPQTRKENIFQFLSFSSPQFGLLQALCMTLKCVNIARIANAVLVATFYSGAKLIKEIYLPVDKNVLSTK